MRFPSKWRSPYVLHAARVALVGTLLIGVTYVCLVVAFDVIDQHRLYGEWMLASASDSDQAAGNLRQAAPHDIYANAHDETMPRCFFGGCGSRVSLFP